MGEKNLVVADNGTINTHNIKKHLQNNNLNLKSVGGSYDNPSNITVNQEITWNKNTLTLHADNDIHINKTLNGTGTAKLALEYEQAYYGGNSDYHIKNGAKVNLSAGLNLNVKQGSGGKIQKFWVIYNLPKNNNYTFDYENLGASAVNINWKYLDKLGYFREISKFYNTKTNHKIPDNFKAQDCHLMQVNCFKRVYTKLEGIKYKQLTKAEQPKPKKLNIDNIDFDDLRKQFSLSTEIRNSDLDVMAESVFAGGGVKLAVGYYSMALDRLNAINKFAYNNMAKGNTLQFIEQGDFPIWITSEEFIKKNKDLTPMEQKLAKEKIENMSSIVSVVGDVFYNIDESDLTNMNGEALTARARVASRLIGADKNLQSFDGLIKLLDMGQDAIEIYGHGENIYNLTNDGMDLYKRLSKIKKDGRELHKELVKTAIEIDKLMFADNPSSHEYLNDAAKIISDNHKNKEIAKMLLDPVKEGIKNAKNSNGVTVITEFIPNIKTAMDKIKTVAVALEIAKKHNEKLAEQKEIENFLKHASHNDKSHNDKVAYLTQIAILKANPNINLRGQKIFTFSKNWWGKYRLVETEIR